MNPDLLRSSRPGYLVAFLGLMGLGVSIGMAQNQPDAQRDRNRPNAAQQQQQQQPRQPDAAQQRQADPRAPAFGLQLDARQNQGLMVSRVDENSVASQSGIKQNDKIISADGRPFTNSRQFTAYLASQQGRMVPVVVERDGRQYTVNLSYPTNDSGAWLGVYLEQGDDNVKGARITHVYPAGPAARAGLQTGDQINKVGDQNVETSADLVAVVQDMKPQQQVEVQVTRGDQQLKIPVTLGGRGNYVYRSFSQDGGNNGWDDHQHGNFGQNYPQGNYGQGQGNWQQQGSNDPYSSVNPYAMQLEHDRRIAEQHERIEREIVLLREEIAKLRQELQKK